MEIKQANLTFKRAHTKRLRTNRIVVHHSASAANTTIFNIQSWHHANGWYGVGYHYVVYSNGDIYQGRPEWVKGAHAYQDAQHDGNSDGIGICLCGNFQIAEPTPEQMTSLVLLIRDIWGRYPGIGIQKHSDVMATACPGKNFPWGTLIKRLDGRYTSEFAEAIKRLADKKIIASPEYWLNADMNNVNVRGDYMAGLLMKTTSTNTLDSAVNYLSVKNVIASPDYWLANCVTGKTCNIDYVRKLVTSAASKLGL